jgi:hypothetical protein
MVTKTNQGAYNNFFFGVTFTIVLLAFGYQRKSNHQSNQSVMLKQFFILCSGADKTF